MSVIDLRKESGEVQDERGVVALLYYLLLRHIPAGALRDAMDWALSENQVHRFTNGWLASYAAHVVDQVSDGLHSMEDRVGLLVADVGGWGLARVLKERIRQKHVKGFDDAHDDEHTNGELAQFAARLADPKHRVPFIEGWDQKWDKAAIGDREADPERWRRDRIRQLEIAGALIGAELDRLLRDTSSA